MSKQELGVKRDCPECGARFYDLNKEPAQCPKCGAEFVPEPLLKPRKPRPDDAPVGDEKAEKPAAETSLEEAEKEKAEPKSKRKAALDEEEDDVDDMDDIEDIDIDDDDDDSLLDDDEDDDDVSEIVKGSGEGDDEA